MAYNPYAVADTLSQLQQSGLKTQTAKRESDVKISGQKKQMEKLMMKEVREAEKKAQAALAKKKKKSKWGGILGGIVSLFNPIAGAVLSGISSASQAKSGAKHLLSQAQLAKKHAMNIDPRWQNTFLGQGAEEYLTQAEKGYGDLVSQAQDAQMNFGDLLKTATVSGIGSYATGKALSGIGENIKAAKGIKELGLGGAGTEGFVGPLPEGATTDIISPTLDAGSLDIAGLADQFGIDETIMSKLLEAKAPGLRGIFEGAKGIGKLGQENIFPGDSGDILKGLLAALGIGGNK
jgi:hypothetical protein